MVIYVTRAVRIDCERDRNFTIQVKRIDKAGKVSWVNSGYYGHLAQAAWAIVEKGLCDADGASNARRIGDQVNEASKFVIARVLDGVHEGSSEETPPDRAVVL